ncbi:MAG: prephenate dehydrogenase [Flavobacteriales bacterium]|nr:prephenate dehydrogenase [Flavobacteriales bacterium]MCB9363379.1 prephenate dehydrogenase [Flavobacteriales bacterium]
MRKNIGIIGLGLIGGSLGLALKNNNHKVYGCDIDSNHNKKALELNLVDKVVSIDLMLQLCDVIFVSTPTKTSINIISNLLDNVNEKQVVIDVGSTKSKICKELKPHKNRKNFVAAHPIAGTENSGPEAAVAELFTAKKIVICNKDESSSKAIASTLSLFEQLKCDVVYMEADEHDKHLAYISHLSHICSFALGLTVLDIEKDEQNIFNLAGSGFSSTARLAKSSPAMWESITMQNKENLLPAIESYIKHLNQLKKDIEDNNSYDLIEKMKKANEIRKIIKN